MSILRPRLGVNIDHVATVRQARRAAYPEPTTAALLAELAGADQITVHLRSDRRHIQDRDLPLLKACLGIPLNVELAATQEMLSLAEALRPGMVTLVPERPGEVTTEGGLDVSAHGSSLQEAVRRLHAVDVPASLFIDPHLAAVEASSATGARIVELNTAQWSEAHDASTRRRELDRIESAARRARALGLTVAAGHGLHYGNVEALADLALIEEYNIGHALIGRAIFHGLDRAVRDMIALLRGGR